VSDRTSPFDVLRKANDRGEIGYAYGGKNEDLPAVQECVSLGYIKWVADASPGFDAKFYGQRRDLFAITDKGRKALADYLRNNPEST
jgi:hypothetical protein